VTDLTRSRIAGSASDTKSAVWAAGLLLLAAFALRADVFGDPVAYSVDQFYLLVGERMHHGAIPYVDIWDRKPPGIFLIYYAISAVSTATWFYQLVATLFAGATAIVVAAIARRWAGLQGSLLAGLIYLVMFGSFNGNTGEAPVFYNLPVALAALWLTGAPERRRFGWAMLALGTALTVKQTVIFEACLFGLFAVYRLERRHALRNAARFVTLGAAPTLLLAAGFAIGGHFAEYWSATVESIFFKNSPTLADVVGRSLDLSRRFIPLVALAVLSLVLRHERMLPYRRFLLGWIGAATIGVIAVPQLYLHYGLPLVLPLAVAASAVLDRRLLGWGLAALAAAAAAIYHPPFQFSRHAQSRQEMAALKQTIAGLPGDSLLVFDGPAALYTLTGRRIVTPLVFPPHLNHETERNVSGIDTNAELARVLKAGADVIVFAETPRNQPANTGAWQLVRAHVAARCHLAAAPVTHDMGRQRLLVYACARRSQ